MKLFFERRKGILGSHLHLKFVLALFLVATIPTAVVFLVAYTFVTASLETWFSLRVDGAIERTREVADAYYDGWAREALHFGERIAGADPERRPAARRAPRRARGLRRRASSASTTSASSRSSPTARRSPSSPR